MMCRTNNVFPVLTIVTVDSVRVNPKPRHEAEMAMRDLHRKSLEVVNWETHEIGQSWELGAKCEITGARGNSIRNKMIPT